MQKWVQKVSVPPPSTTKVVTANIGAHPLVADASSYGGPTREVELSIAETPITTLVTTSEPA